MEVGGSWALGGGPVWKDEGWDCEPGGPIMPGGPIGPGYWAGGAETGEAEGGKEPDCEDGGGGKEVWAAGGGGPV